VAVERTIRWTRVNTTPQSVLVVRHEDREPLPAARMILGFGIPPHGPGEGFFPWDVVGGGADGAGGTVTDTEGRATLRIGRVQDKRITVTAAVGHVAGARLAPSFGTWPTTLWAITAGGALLLPLLLWQGEAAALVEAGVTTWSAVLFLAGGSTLLAFAAWYRALSRGGIARMGALQFLQPLVTLALAALLLGEPVTPALLGAAGLILAGVALTQYRGGQRR
jgi:uncharacterized membrane protein